MTFAEFPLFAQAVAEHSSEGIMMQSVAKNIIPILAITLGIIWLIVLCVMEQWRKVRISEQNAILKKDMLERGFSADEIVRVIRSGYASDKMAKKNEAS